MRIAIIALVFSLGALGLAGFATFISLDNDAAKPAAEATWSEAECEEARSALRTLRLHGCVVEGNCAPYNDMLQAIAENCP